MHTRPYHTALRHAAAKHALPKQELLDYRNSSSLLQTSVKLGI